MQPLTNGDAATGCSLCSIRRRLGSWLFAPNHSHSFLRGIATSIVFAVYTITITAALMMKETLRRGEVPWYTIDAIIVGVSLLDVVFAPSIAWLGWWRRRTTMMICMVPSFVIIFAIFAIPAHAPTNATEFCKPESGHVTSDDNSAAVARLVLIVIICAVVSLTLTAFLCHSIGYMAEHNLNGLFVSFGILVMVRIVGLLVLAKMLTTAASPIVLVLLTCLTVAIHLLQLVKVGETAPPAEGTVEPSKEDRGLVDSIGRVVSNRAAMTLIFAMALNAAALWGFSYHETDIIKEKYLLIYPEGYLTGHADILRYHVIFLIVLVIARKYANPLMAEFTRGPVLKMAAMLGTLAVPLYVVTAWLSCQRGNIAGLSAANYTQPNCSLTCGCDPTQSRFAPLCSVEQMETYLSPCHAGCSSTADANGFQYLSGCICTGGLGRALLGGCNASECRDSFEYHKLIYCIITLSTVGFLQLLGVVAIRAVDGRDRSVVIGVMIAVTSFVVFVVGHAIFFAIRAYTCVWFEAGFCQLHSPHFSFLVSGVAAFLTLIAALISIAAYFFLSDNKAEKESAEAFRSLPTPTRSPCDRGQPTTLTTAGC